MLSKGRPIHTAIKHFKIQSLEFYNLLFFFLKEKDPSLSGRDEISPPMQFSLDENLFYKEICSELLIKSGRHPECPVSIELLKDFLHLKHIDLRRTATLLDGAEHYGIRFHRIDLNEQAFNEDLCIKLLEDVKK